MKRTIKVAFVVGVSCAWAASAVASTGEPVEVENAGLSWVDDSCAVLAGDAGAFMIEQMNGASGCLVLNLTFLPAEVGRSEVSVTGVVFEDAHSKGHQGRAWSGEMNGERVRGTLRVLMEDPGSGDVCFHWHAIDGAGCSVLDLAITVDVDAAHELVTELGGVGVWPWKSYCGCDSLNVLCASNRHCQQPTPCPSGSPDTCHWIIIFDPWYIATGAQSQP
ncbi:MAG: hypothetical protein PVJ57_11950 [Phycisphaerae bacterium]|jgi:hypothetical protein